MTPTIVLKDGKPVAGHRRAGRQPHHHHRAAGDPQRIEFGKPIGEAVTPPRIHHQWRPDEVMVEKTLPADIVRGLAARGHKVRIGSTAGSAHSIMATPDGYVGAADQRARGSLAEGY